MLFESILGQYHIKKHLIHSVQTGRIPHAQLFLGPEGSGTLEMAIAYAQYILCQNTGGENTGGNESCNLKFQHFNHPDLHFVFPTVTTDEVKTKPKSADFLPLWREFLLEKAYNNLFDWYEKLGVGNKQGVIRTEDANEIVRLLSLKSYEGGYKIMIIWMAEYLNTEASNKILKILEEPTDRTVIILIAEDENGLLQTIQSRCQIVQFNKLPDDIIAKKLIADYNLDESTAKKIAFSSQGNYTEALHLYHTRTEKNPFEEWFVEWVRAAYRAKGNAAVIQELITWSEKIAGLGRESQKRFLHYCSELFRQALLVNYQPQLVYLQTTVPNFDLSKLAPFVNGNNIEEITSEIEKAIYHIERNGNGKIILTDLSIKLTRLIHKN